MSVAREPDCKFCGGKTPPDNPPLYYISCKHDELCPMIWAWKLARSAETISATKYVKEFADYIEKVRLRHLGAAQEWIPCEEREPEREGRYLIVYEQGPTRRAFIGDYLPGEGWTCLTLDTFITHWKEIGELPEVTR